MFWFIQLVIIGVFVLGLRTARLGRKRAIRAAFLWIYGLAIKFYLDTDPVLEARLFPFTDYVKLQGYWFYVLAAGFFGVAAGMLTTRRKKALACGIAAVVTCYGAWQNLWLVVAEQHGSQVYADSLNHCRQSTGYTCAPSAAVSALAYFNVHVSEAEMARRCLTNTRGTGPFNLYRGLRLSLPKDQYDVRIAEVHAQQLCEEGSVAVTGLRDFRHSVCLRGTGHSVVVHDPLKPAPEEWSVQKLRDHFTGTAVVVRRRGEESSLSSTRSHEDSKARREAETNGTREERTN